MDSKLLRKAYDREAARYDARFAAQQRPKYEALARWVQPPAPGARVLDLGGGTGLLARTLRALDPRWSAVHFTVVDLSREMLRAARPHLPDLVQADARKLPFRRGAFSQVWCVTGLVALEHVRPALVSACRVLAPGGTLALGVRPWDLPEACEELEAQLPLEEVGRGSSEGDLLFAWRRL